MSGLAQFVPTKTGELSDVDLSAGVSLGDSLIWNGSKFVQTGTSTVRGLQNEVWISVRTDGRTGTGTVSDPYDGSTATKLASIFTGFGATTNLHIRFGPGTFQINFANAAGRGITVKNGWTIEGCGQSVTTIQAIGNLAGIHYGCVILGSDFTVSTDSVTVKDLTLDCNWAGIGSSADTGSGGEKNVKTGGVGIWGSNNLVEHVHVINSYGSLANSNERFDIALLGPTTANGSNNTIRFCNCELPQGTYGAPYLLAGSGGYILSNSRVQNCSAYGVNNGGNSGYNTGGVNLAYINNVTISGNDFVDCGMIAYQDTGSFDGLFVYSNTLVRGLVGSSFGVVGVAQKNLVVLGNRMGLQNRIFGGAVYGIVINSASTTNVKVSDNTFTYQNDGTGLDDYHNCLVHNLVDASFDNNVLWDVDNQLPYDPNTFGTNVNSTNNLTRIGNPGISAAAPVNSKDNDLVGSLRISGTLGSGGAGIRFAKPHVFTVASGQTLQYEVYCDDTSPAFVPSVYLRDAGFGYAPATYDQNNIDSTLGDVSRFSKGKWYHREINLTPIAGFAASYLYYGLESSTIAGNYVYYFRNIRLVNSSGVTLFNYWTPEVQTADSGQDSYNATSVTNTPYFLNVSSSTPNRIAVYSSGYDGSGTHFLADDNTFKTAATGALLKANNLSDVNSASSSLTNLGGTTSGKNLFTLTDPSAISFVRINADNSVSALSKSGMQSALSLSPGTDVQAYSANLTTVAAISVNSFGAGSLASSNSSQFQSYIGLGYLFSGTGSPEGVVTAGVGSRYARTNGGAGTSLYVKESGSGNTGWVAYAGGQGNAPAGGATGEVLTKNSNADYDYSWAAVPGSGGGGTVTSVSVVTANGVSGTVATATSTPAITLALGAITPTTVVASGNISGSNLSGTNTGDQTITLTGDVTGIGTGSFSATIGANAVTFAKMQTIANNTIVGNNTGGTAVPLALTATQTRTLLGLTIGTNVEAWSANLDAFSLKTCPVGAVVGTSDTQTLTSKTIDSAIITGSTSSSGSSNFDLSASSGTFKTSTGANTLYGAVLINDSTTPSLTTAAGKTNTGFVYIQGKTSGGLKLTTADVTTQLITATLASQTVGNATITIPDFAGVNDTFVFSAKTATLTNKTLTSPVINSGSAVTTTGTQLNYLSAATGTTGTTSTNLVFSTSPTLVTPVLGVASATSINKWAFTAPSTSVTITAGSDNLNYTLPEITCNIGFREIPQNSKSVDYTTVAADNGKHIYHPSTDTTSRTYTIDSNVNVPYPVGTALMFVNDVSAGTLTIAITSDTLVNASTGATGSFTLTAPGMATALKVAATRWMIR